MDARHDTLLVYLTGALGDVILTTPALALVREACAGRHVHVIAPRYLAELYPGLYDSFTSADAAAVAGLFSAGARESLSAHPAWRDATTAVLFERGGSVIARRMGEAGLRVVNIDALPGANAGGRYGRLVWQRTAAALGIAGAFSIPAPCARAPAREPRQPFAVVHPGSGSPRKVAPAALLAGICRARRADQACEVLVLRGEADEEAVAGFLGAWGGAARVIDQPPLPEAAWLLAHAAFYVGNDSGISHLAGVAGARGCVVFGPTDPRVWRPFGAGLEVLRFPVNSSDRARP